LLYNSCRDSLNIIALEHNEIKGLDGIVINVSGDVNKEAYDIYRNAYSNYDCYLINRSGRIIDKFQIFDWESNLKRYK
jgi:hypothetical protein